jgi:predicted exporter
VTRTPPEPRSPSSAARLLWLLIFAGLIGLGPARLAVRESITDFMPRGERSDALALASELADSTLARGRVLCIHHPEDREAAIDLAGDLAAALEAHPEVAWVSGGVAPDELETVHTLYFPRRHYFVSNRPEQRVPELTGDAALRQRAREVRRSLAGPLPSLEAELTGRDPLGLFAALVERMRDLGPALRVEQERFVAVDPGAGGAGSWAVLFLETRGSPFDSARQAPLQEAIEASFERLAAERGEGFVLEQGGSHRIALATERAMRRDMRVVSSVSLLGVVTLLLIFLGSLRSVLLVIAPVLLGLAAAMAIGVQAFGSLHVVTLAFGASLVGIAVDYSIHLVNQHALAPAGATPAATARQLLPSLLLGGVTTIAGFGGFLLTSFPGVREMGIFAVCGVAAAVTATLLAVPAFLPERPAPPRVQVATAAALGRWAQRATASGRLGWLLLAVCALLCALGLPRVRWNDDPASLTAVDPRLLAEDERVRRRVSPVDPTRFVVARARERETVIATNDEVWRRLEPLIENDRLEGAQSLHPLVWSRALQERNLAALREDPTLPDRLDRAFAEVGFRAGAFDGWREELARAGTPPLEVDDLANTSLARLVRPLLIEHEGEHWCVTYLRGVHDPEAVAAAVAGLEGVHSFDSAALYARLFAEYRRDALRLVALGTVLVFAALWLRYRGPRAAVAALLPALLAIPTSLAILGLLGAPVNLLGAVSLVLVLGLGVDYGVFVVDARTDPGRLGPTLLSLLLSCQTTLLAFGVLAISSHPALRTIGLVTALGVVLALAAAPVAAAFSRTD